MSVKDKLVERLLSVPKDFTFDDLKKLLGKFGYSINNKGKTSGSRITFIKPNGDMISLHKPHPGNELKAYQIKYIIDKLRESGEFDE